MGCTKSNPITAFQTFNFFNRTGSYSVQVYLVSSEILSTEHDQFIFVRVRGQRHTASIIRNNCESETDGKIRIILPYLHGCKTVCCLSKLTPNNRSVGSYLKEKPNSIYIKLMVDCSQLITGTRVLLCGPRTFFSVLNSLSRRQNFRLHNVQKNQLSHIIFRIQRLGGKQCRSR